MTAKSEILISCFTMWSTSGKQDMAEYKYGKEEDNRDKYFE